MTSGSVKARALALIAALALGGCATDGLIAYACDRSAARGDETFEACQTRIHRIRAVERAGLAEGFAAGLSAPVVYVPRYSRVYYAHPRRRYYR